MRIPIRLLMALLLLLFGGSVGTILFAQQTTTESELIASMQSILVNVSDGTIARSEAFLSDARDDATLTAALVGRGSFDSEEELDLYLSRILETSPSASGAFFGDVNGEFVFVSRYADAGVDGFRTKAIRIEDEQREVELIYRDAGFTTQRSEFDPADTYDPTTRPWFQSAVDQSDAVITDPYVFFSSQQPGVTTAQRVFDTSGELRGVVGIDTSLTELSAFLGELSLGPNGSAFIFNRSGELVALGGRQELQQPDGEGFRLARVDEIDDPRPRRSFERLQEIGAGAEDTPQFFILDSEGSADHVFVAPIGGTNWVLGVTLSESDFLGDIRRSQRDNVFVALFVGLVAVAIAAMLIRNITGPLSALRNRAAAVEGGTLPSDAPIRTRITELQRTSDAFDHMLAGLAEQEAENATLLGELETRVQTRTADLRQESEERRAAELRAEEASEAKSRFLASMSHEFRTPLNAILGFADLTSIQAFGPVGDERYVDFAKETKSAASHLVELVSDVLDLAQIEASELRLNETTFDVAHVTERVVGLLAQLALANRVEVHFEASSAPLFIHADERRIRQVLLNLLSNSIKFTPPSGRVDVVVTSGKGTTIQITDTGRGMSNEEIELALTPYGQINGSSTTARTSTGLGLPITQALVEAHGGTLSISSDPGVGTTVTIELPNSALSNSEPSNSEPSEVASGPDAAEHVL